MNNKKEYILIGVGFSGFLICLIISIILIRKNNKSIVETVINEFGKKIGRAFGQEIKKSSNASFVIFSFLTIIFLGIGISGTIMLLKQITGKSESPYGLSTNSIDGNNVTIGSSNTPLQSAFRIGTGTNRNVQSNLANLVNSATGPVTYKNIGFGPAIDKNSMIKWLNPSAAGWTDGNGNSIILESNKLRTQQGFMPPSFEYFPEGQNSTTYNPDNYENGRRMCMEACNNTDCIALQTEVPQVCYNEIIPLKNVIPTGIDNDGNIVPTNKDPENPQFKNTCGKNSTHACTLFYNNIEHADDAYFTLAKQKPQNVGLKYYEENDFPEISPSNPPTMPSQSNIKWCPSSITEPDLNSTIYASISGNNDCSCKDGQICDDSKCCKMRNLLTTEFARNKFPYYNLPIRVDKNPAFPDSITEAVNIDANGVETCCGICEEIDPNNKDKKIKKIVSCLKDKCIADGQKNCWHIDAKSCNGPIFSEGVESTEAMNEFLNTCTGKSAFDCSTNPSCEMVNGNCVMSNSSGKSYNFTPLMKNCFYKNQSVVPTIAQAKIEKTGNVKLCDPTKVERGCFGSPNILYIENVGDIGACSNNSLIPSRERCVNDPIECQPTADDPNKCLCKGFPYGCGTAFGSNRLWTKS